MYTLTANFYEAQQEKNGYIGKADITIGNAIQLNNISVFVKDGITGLAFAKFGKDNERSYVIPASKEAYAAMVAVVENAIAHENHFGYTKGEYGVRLEVNGARVNEPYADGRFSIKVGDFCTLNGISTRVVEHTKDGKDASFVAVDLPRVEDADGKVKLYTGKDGKERADLQFEGVKNKFTKDGKEVSTDYGVLINNMVRKCRKELGQSLDNTIEAAKAEQHQRRTENVPPNKEQTR